MSISVAHDRTRRSGFRERKSSTRIGQKSGHLFPQNYQILCVDFDFIFSCFVAVRVRLLVPLIRNSKASSESGSYQ